MPLGLLPALGPTEVLVVLTALLLLAWPACRVCAKAGFPGALGLLAVVPGLNLALLLGLAFLEWPALRRRPAGPADGPPDGRRGTISGTPS